MSMLQISRNTLRKLTHESTEIRLRTLEQIANKLERALALKERVDIKSVELCKQLIRWFGFTPIRNALKVLNLLKHFLQSEEHGEDVVKCLGVERLRKELRKIHILLEGEAQELFVLQEINELLKVYEISGQGENQDQDDIEEMIRNTNGLTIKCGIETPTEEFSGEDYEIAWSRPSTSDYTSMKLMADILINKFASVAEVQNVLLHLQLTMGDYPAEYLLQAPHIFRNLLQVYVSDGQTVEIPNDLIASTLCEFLNVLEKRLEYRRKSLYFPFSTQARELSKMQTPSQLKVSKAISDLLSASISHLALQPEHNEASPIVWEIIFKILKLFGTLKLQVAAHLMQKLEGIILRVGQRLVDTEQQTRLRLYQVQLIFLFQDAVQNNAHCKPLEGAEVFESLLKDYSVKCLYPVRFHQIKDILCENNTSIKEKYQLLESYENSLQLAIKILGDSRTPAGEVIQKGQQIASVLDILQSKQLADILFANLLEAIPLYLANHELRTNAIDLIIKLLNVSFKPLQVYAYEKLLSLFKRHLGCLMNGETYVKECSNRSLLEVGILGVPLNTNIMLNIVNSGFGTSEQRIQNVCCKILELLLQSPSLLESNWSKFVRLLVPVLPLISCWSFSKKIIELLMKLNDPDSRHLPYVTVLQGNIAFLYHAQPERRSEALTRLIYTLNSLSGSEKYMPNLLHISDTLPNDICLLTAPREYHHIFNDRSSLRADAVASLNNLFHLLESPDVEPLIRKTTLMQINVLCSNWHMTGEFCKAGAYYLILQSLENALQTANCVDYPDSAIPATSILNKVLLYDSSVRCELSETPNIYILLLRSLMMFNHDIQIRQDASMCLFQLIFANQLIATENQIEGPMILGNLQIPLNIHLKTAAPCNGDGDYTTTNISSVFGSSLEETQYWRFVIGEASLNGLCSVTQKSSAKQTQLDIREDLKLNSQDIRIIRAAQPGVSLKRLVKAASNATDHKSLMQVCTMLKQHLLIPQLPNTFTVDIETSNALCYILTKYLQLQPSNTTDLELYEHLLDVSMTCLHIPLMAIVTGFSKSLHKDIRHAFITMLTQKEEIPLIIYYKISKLLKHLVQHYKDEFAASLSTSECSAFFSNIFDLLMERCLQLFGLRDLQRVRCLLSIMVAITACNLDMPDKLLLYYSRRFLQLSVALKSFTQTGSQWHRDCLLSILQLQRQMQDGRTSFRLTPGIVKYLSGLCGHTDAHIRVMVWSILYIVSQTKPVAASEPAKVNTNSECSGAELLLKELSYLPGGFTACCISTLLDPDEVIWIRQLAGQVFANLLNKQNDIEKNEKLLEQHYFVRAAGEALNTNVCVLSNRIPEGLEPSNTQITTCELISSFTQICIEMSRCSPLFLDELCTRTFMFKLYEIFKQPLSSSSSNYDFYTDMVSDICCLYAMCYENNFLFLQRTICRDPIWLNCYCKILFSIVSGTRNSNKIVAMLQLLMILFKDATALEHLSTKMMEYSADIVKLFQYAFSIRQYGGSLQRCILSVLSLLCIKAQPQVGGQVSDKVLEILDGEHIINGCIKDLEEAKCADNKENLHGDGKKDNMNGKIDADDAKRMSSAISEHLCISLIHLFTHLYPIKTCKFTTAPNECQQQVVETLALLLKVSPNAQETAHNLKLHDIVMGIFKYFFEEFATTSCTTYVKRHGEIKKLTVVKNLQLVFKFLLNWHSAPSMTITDDILAIEYSKIIIRIWPWLVHSGELKLTVLKVCAFLCERSLIMCKRFSTVNNSAFAHSILQLAIKQTTAETVKVKASSTDCFPIIFFGLRIIMNCSSCVEGRNALNKAHIMDMFDSLYPFNLKAARLKSDILDAWLQFWEIFSRYEEGSSAHHLNALCGVINRSKSETRLLSLRILRNMTFLNSNRTTLLNSTDFIYTVNEILSQPLEPPCSVEEQLIVGVALWQLISGGVKFVAMIRGTKLSKQLRILRDSLKIATQEKNEKVKFGKELLKVLEIMFKIFEG